MKTLHLIRHAKSSWKDESLADIDRPLAPRGIRACALMAEKIAAAGCGFSHVFTSAAVRAQATIRLIAETLGIVQMSWTVADGLYTFSAHDLLEWCRDNLPADIDQAVIVGHNPAMQDLSNLMQDAAAGKRIEKLPTCAYVQMVLDDDSWTRLGPGRLKLITFLTPKMFK